VRHAGVSNYGLARWRSAEEALGGPILSNQVRFSLVNRKPLDELVPFAQREGRIVIAYSPLGQGLLGGRYDSSNRPSGMARRTNPLFLPENLERAAPLLATLREVADAHSVTPSQAALAYVVHHPYVVAIPGASSEEQVEANAAAGDLELAPDEYEALRAAAAAFRPVTGARAVPRLLSGRLLGGRLRAAG